MKGKDVSWEEFKEIVENDRKNSSDEYTIAYRGQKDIEWDIESTLFRYLKKIGRPKSQYHFNDYFRIVKSLINGNKKLKNKFEFPDNPLPLIGPLIPPQFEFEAARIILAYAELRHYGFPSPLVDWSLDPYVAVYFAFEDPQVDSTKSIFSFKQISSRFDHTKPMLYHLDHTYIAQHCLVTSSTANDSRHLAQKSCYSLILHNAVYEHLGPDNPNKHNPYTSLVIKGDLIGPSYVLEKYNIKDSEKKEVASNIINELKEKNITKETLLVAPSKIYLSEYEFEHLFKKLLDIC